MAISGSREGMKEEVAIFGTGPLTIRRSHLAEERRESSQGGRERSGVGGQAEGQTQRQGSPHRCSE
jgi:hypothetical protein